MASTNVIPTVFDLVSGKGPWSHATLARLSRESMAKEVAPSSSSPVSDPESVQEETEVAQADVADELRIPDLWSLAVVIGGNAMFQLSFFIIVSSASEYAGYLGGSALFSGLVIGIPTAASALVLIPITRRDGGKYRMPFFIAYAASTLGCVLYALAYTTHFLYLILIGRIVGGIGFIAFMYCKRYVTDSRLVGVRRRTTLGSYLVLGQGIGFSAGPFLGGLLYKFVGFQDGVEGPRNAHANNVWNGFTATGWVMAGAWVVFAIFAYFKFTDVKDTPAALELRVMKNQQQQQTPQVKVSLRQWGVIITMMYWSMTCFLVLGAWESNIPIFTADALGYSPYAAGNFIALGGIATVPFLLLNTRFSRKFQDRTILATGSVLGLAGVLTALGLLVTDRVSFGAYLACWFLVALGFNLASTCTVALLSKQFPPEWNGRLSMAIQYSNYTGRVSGALLGGAGVDMGMKNFMAVQVAIIGFGAVLYFTLWRHLKAKTG
ncbi:major facilitator superfamily domain-containing protein [Schizophyllum amplum]|uniref:Major facilitator superfamily domain-containing protein n=1 Tax=Schizophyllum amplum TaxID=97359 RepID=A0A550D0I5_9AGAR|nr:major facilitator superfamily domain-containing protein [Auriculariopsis ampla]